MFYTDGSPFVQVSLDCLVGSGMVLPMWESVVEIAVPLGRGEYVWWAN